MSNSTYIEEDDYRKEVCQPSAPKKEKRRVEDVKPEPQEEKVTPDNFKYNIGDIIKVNDPNTNLLSPCGEKEYHDNLRVIFRFYDGNHVYIVEAEDGICLILPEYQAELVERSTTPNTPPDNAADVLRALGWEVKINEKENYWSLVLTNTTSSENMPQSHKSCLRGLLRGWLMEFNYEGGHQQVNIYKELHGLDPEDDRYSCLDACVKRTDGNTPEHELDDREIFVRRKDRFDRYVLTEPIDEHLTTSLTCGSKFNPDNKPEPTQEANSRLLDEDTYQALRRLGILDTSVRSYNRGASDYSRHIIQPWTIWQDYNLNPWDADIVKCVLRTKQGDSRRLDYEKIIHICQERIRQIDLNGI